MLCHCTHHHNHNTKQYHNKYTKVTSTWLLIEQHFSIENGCCCICMVGVLCVNLYSQNTHFALDSTPNQELKVSHSRTSAGRAVRVCNRKSRVRVSQGDSYPDSKVYGPSWGPSGADSPHEPCYLGIFPIRKHRLSEAGELKRIKTWSWCVKAVLLSVNYEFIMSCKN